jgi:hypothetical protein
MRGRLRNHPAAKRPAAASVTAVSRSLAASLSPTLAGALMATPFASLPLVICGSLKVVYDLALLASFRHLKAPEEMRSAAGNCCYVTDVYQNSRDIISPGLRQRTAILASVRPRATETGTNFRRSYGEGKLRRLSNFHTVRPLDILS